MTKNKPFSFNFSKLNLHHDANCETFQGLHWPAFLLIAAVFTIRQTKLGHRKIRTLKRRRRGLFRRLKGGIRTLVKRCGRLERILRRVEGGRRVKGALRRGVRGRKGGKGGRVEGVVLGWRFMSCSHCQQISQNSSWPLIGCMKVSNQSVDR